MLIPLTSKMIEERKDFMSASDRLNELLRNLREFIISSVPNMDRLISQTEIIEREGRKLIVKKFTKEIGLIKWIPPAIIFRATYPFSLLAKERFRREVRFLTNPWTRFKTPRIVEVHEEELTIVREYVDGEILNYRRNLPLLATALAEIHMKGWALGDVKPTNFIVSSREELYVIDAEQAVDSGNTSHMSWDLMLTAFFAAYAYLFDLEGYKKALKVFFNTYLAQGGHYSAVEEVGGFKFGGLIFLMPLPHSYALAETIDNITLKRIAK
jgi:tRNA A-37 threonylcarbamoyl transferase component Bud32